MKLVIFMCIYILPSPCILRVSALLLHIARGGRGTQRRDQRSVSQLKSVISFQESGQLSILKHQLTALWESKCLYCLTLVVLYNIIE